MSQIRGVFSADGRWWWDGAAWMPSRSPDGHSFKWTGSAWRKSTGRLGTEALIGLGSALSFLELVWLIVVIAILTTLANDQYEARGRTGTESITDAPGAVVMLLSLLVVPLAIVILAALLGGRRWWLGVLFGGWPAALIAFLALISPGSGRLESIAAMGSVIAVITAAGWLVSRIGSREWALSADGSQWIQGKKSLSTVSADGRWRWDGSAWRPAGLQAVLQPDHLQAQAAGAHDFDRHQEDRPE